MFKSIMLSGIADGHPHSYQLDPAGPNRIEGPSGSGKSALISAIVALVTGDNLNRTIATDATEEAKSAEVEGTTAKGTVLAIRQSRASWTGSQNGTKLASKAAYIAALKAYGGDDLRYIIEPMAWRSLATGTAQPLLELIQRLIPGGDVAARVREIMAAEWHEGDATTTKPGALAQQTAANADSDRAGGALIAARQRLASAQAARAAIVAPSHDEVAVAHATEAAAADWRVYDAAARLWAVYDSDFADWQTRTPGEAPAYDATDHQAARVKVETLRTKLAKETAEANAESERIAAAERATKAAEAERIAADARAVEAERRRVAEAAAAALAAERAERARVAAEERARVAAEAAQARAVAAALTAERAKSAPRPTRGTAPLFVPPDGRVHACPTCTCSTTDLPEAP